MGGGAGAGFRNGQDPTTWLGAILRIDVDSRSGGLEYGVPPDNPFVGNEDGWREEIWAYGLRNPWRFSFDRKTGVLWAGDVGQGSREEVDIIERGGNYGWNVMEGSNCFRPSTGCSREGLALPVVEYGHSVGRSITGGYVYRGGSMPWLEGTYFFADYCSNQIWTLERSGSNVIVTDVTDDLDPPGSTSIASPSGFGLDGNGEMYICDLGGEVFKILPGVATGACCVNDTVCVPLPESNCIAGGGTYMGDFVACSSVDCAAACDGDCNGDGVVAVEDLLQLIADFGNASECDWNDDGIATVEDILVLLGAWGPC